MSILLPECPNCSTVNKAVKLSKGKNTLECLHCDYSIEFKETNGAILNQGHVETDVRTDAFVWLQAYTEPPNESLDTMIQEYLPREPYAGCDSLKKYVLVIDWRLEAHYE